MGYITRIQNLSTNILKDKEITLESFEITGWTIHEDGTATIYLLDVDGNNMPLHVSGKTLVLVSDTFK